MGAPGERGAGSERPGSSLLGLFLLRSVECSFSEAVTSACSSTVRDDAGDAGWKERDVPVLENLRNGKRVFEF